MKKHIIILILFATGFFSCDQNSKSTLENVSEHTFKLIKDEKKSGNKGERVYTKYEYNDSKGAKLTIQNSFPKGGMKYKDLNGNEFVYAVFWTKIMNETDNPLEVKIDFPIDSYEIPSLPGKYYKVLIPSDTMTIKKVPSLNYGLKDLAPFFDKSSDKPSSLKRTIK